MAPLNLPGVTNAEYSLAVYEGGTSSAPTVWSKSDISADNFGDGAGSLTFVGACSDTNLAGPTTNLVSLVLEDLYEGTPPSAIPTSKYVNPCPSSTPCHLTASCEENTDVAVTFNLAIMRDAEQGFFDIGINFSDVFCSAKVDCQENLLFNDAGVRGPTAVIAFA